MRYNILKTVTIAIACLSFVSFAALPELKITTQNNAEPAATTGCSGQSQWGMCMGESYNIHTYIGVTNFQLTDPNNSGNNITRASKPDSIRTRGNSTATAAKKPYRIKLGEKIGLFGKEPAKSWVLLANFYDGTFALNAMAFELGRRLGLDFTNSYLFVDLYINNQYKGIYQLTEQIQSNPGRVDVKEKKNGWLVEFDYHAPAPDEKLSWFTTGSNRYNLTTFIKAPELEEMDNPTDSTQLRFVKTDIMALVNKMAENNFPNNGYRDLIDLESFAKYVLIQLVMDNFDFNSKTQTGYLPGSNFAYKVESSTNIQAGPLWDFDLAAGVTTNGFPKHYNTYQDPIIPRHPFYERLWADPVFKAKYKKIWDKCKSDFQSMSSIIDNVSSAVSGSVTGKGNNCWANNQMMGSGCTALTTQQFNTEVTNLKTWWTNRLNWVDQQLSSINTSADTDPEPTTSCKTSSSSSNTNNGSSSSSSANNEPITLTCTGLQASVERGGTIDEPTLTCSNGSPTTNVNWTGRPNSNRSWTTNVASTTASYTIGVNANCLPAQGLTAACGTVIVDDATPITKSPNSINLSNHQGAKVEVYNLKGKLVYSGYSGNSQTLQIPVQTKGIYIVRTTLGSEKKIQRIVVK